MKLYPTLRYADPRAAYDWLERVLGFEPVALHADGDRVTHAELRWGADIVMFGPPPDGAPVVPATVYVSCDDADACFARAKDAGAEIVREPADQDYGSRDFAVRDPEGHTWSFGTYEPR